ncbi:unnamed protein product [Paramecium octaurelia]|uniref:Uncharacterized protein n=1 Tax=Paramecium octaurelia TaxID=43137 RepID=A0A8S1UIS2_PAROT|nr:unnamed protein product [Paramecium octaurelia]
MYILAIKNSFAINNRIPQDQELKKLLLTQNCILEQKNLF